MSFLVIFTEMINLQEQFFPDCGKWSMSDAHVSRRCDLIRSDISENQDP